MKTRQLSQIDADRRAYVQIDTVRVRSDHIVYEGPKDYLVKSVVRNDPNRAYGEPISKPAVASVVQILVGGTAQIKDVTREIEASRPETLGFLYSYGYKLRFEVERALIVGVATRQLTLDKRGGQFYWSAAG